MVTESIKTISIHIIMEFLQVLTRYYGDKKWSFENTYESLKWFDISTKPTEDELNIKLVEFKKERMREERNKLLKNSDFRVLSDYNNDKDKWIQYRQSLRDLPTSWVEGMPFPSPPQ